MKDALELAIKNENEGYLIKYLQFYWKNKTEVAEYEYLEKALIGTWHSQHEDLVNMIYLQKLIDDRFVEPILNIALNKEKYRSYDLDLESTLRKCVHVLKMINSKKSNLALNKLIKLDNDNIKSVLEMYD